MQHKTIVATSKLTYDGKTVIRILYTKANRVTDTSGRWALKNANSPFYIVSELTAGVYVGYVGPFSEEKIAYNPKLADKTCVTYGQEATDYYIGNANGNVPMHLLHLPEDLSKYSLVSGGNVCKYPKRREINVSIPNEMEKYYDIGTYYENWHIQVIESKRKILSQSEVDNTGQNEYVTPFYEQKMFYDKILHTSFKPDIYIVDDFENTLETIRQEAYEFAN